MSAVLFPLSAAAVAAVVTYWSCLRPMRRGRGCGQSDLQTQLDEARAELARLRAEQVGSAPSGDLSLTKPAQSR